MKSDNGNEATTRAEAIERGLSYYSPRTVCKNGHTAKRQTLTGNCYECMLERVRQYRRDQRAKMRANKRKRKSP